MRARAMTGSGLAAAISARGGDGNDTIYAEDGDDTAEGGAGDD